MLLEDASVRCRMLASSSCTHREARPSGPVIPPSVAGAAFPGTAELVADLLHPPHQQRPGMPITGTSGHQGQQPSPSSLTAQNIPFRVGGN
jgi:hypothetical protein